jgi:peptidoglycan hydrolase-like protein with peptidoglycan-binding domain
MFDVYNAIILSLPDNQLLAPYRPYPGFLITLGFDGSYMIPLQTYLNAISTVFAEVPKAGNSGVFDEATRNAVLSVQKLVGLEITGVVNLDTWNAIGDLYSFKRCI